MAEETPGLLAERAAIIKRLALTMEESKRLQEKNQQILAQSAILHTKITHQLQEIPHLFPVEQL